jgi:TetR/AcrR family transcriptional repressor of lmrAB and yxaGH operons
MPALIVPLEEVLARLMQTFRKEGYDGASLSEISKCTGLGKSSLYHHFPGGKVEMAERVLSHLEVSLERDLFEPLRASGSPRKKLDAMLATLDAFYAGGANACLLERLAGSTDRARFRRPLARAFSTWIDAIQSLCEEAGVPSQEARRRAEDAVVRIEGALVVSAGTHDTGPFQRALAELRQKLLVFP